MVEHHVTIGSTNDRARELAHLGTPEIAVIVADEQTAGRGRQNRSWYTPAGTALAFSLLTRPAIAPQRAMRLTMLAGLAAVEGIEWATDLRLDLKWPNDVVILTDEQPMMKKVGGILTECAFQGDDHRLRRDRHRAERQRRFLAAARIARDRHQPEASWPGARSIAGRC